MLLARMAFTAGFATTDFETSGLYRLADRVDI
jgi:hypothetical protein